MLLMATTMLAGCGEGSDSGFIAPVKPGTEQTQYYAQDVVRQNSSAGAFYVDLSTNIGSNDGTKVALSQVTALGSDADCRVVSQDSSGFTIKARSAQVCDYRYRVGPALAMMSTEISGSGYAEATVRAVTGNSSDLLMPISAVTSTGHAVSINIKLELGKLGYELSENFVLSNIVTLPLTFTTYSAAIAHPDEHTIDYIPGPGIPSGIERVLYRYKNPEGDVLAGTIDIAVSTESNRAPTAESVKLRDIVDPETGEKRETVPWNKTVEIDVAPLISDPDGDELQLVDVFVYGAQISIPYDANNDGNPFNDPVFHFSATESGTKDISYTVSDLKGGYATGVIQVEVDGPYADIDDFSAPHTVQQAAGLGAQFEPYGPGNGVTALNSVINASYDFDRAKAVCATQGKYLPYESKLRALYKKYPDQTIFNKKNWPINLPYWMADGSVFNFGSGTTLSASDTEYRYVTCTSNGEAEVTLIEVFEKSKLEVPISLGLKQEPKLKLTYETGETKIVDAQSISVQDLSVAEITEDNGVVGINAGTTKIYMELDGFFVDYTLNVVELELTISGAALLMVGEKRQLNVSYKDPDSGAFFNVDNTYITNFTSDSPNIATVEQSDDRSYYITGVSDGKTRISAEVNLYNHIYHIEADVSVIAADWCWKRGVSYITGERVCIGYEEAVTSAPGVAEFVELWGMFTHNPYVVPEHLYNFCNAFNLEPFELLKENISREKIIPDDGSLGVLYQVENWGVISDEGPRNVPDYTTSDEYITFSAADPTSLRSVPICLLSKSRVNNIQARMLSE